MHGDRHVGQHELHTLKRADRLTELLALLGVAHGGVERGLADADRLGPDRRARRALVLQRDAPQLDVARAGRAAIVLARVDMLQMLSNRAIAIGDAFLFDVGMEGIKQNADARMIDLIAQLYCVFSGIEEERLEPVERLYRHIDSSAIEHRPQ